MNTHIVNDKKPPKFFKNAKEAKEAYSGIGEKHIDKKSFFTVNTDKGDYEYYVYTRGNDFEAHCSINRIGHSKYFKNKKERDKFFCDFNKMETYFNKQQEKFIRVAKRKLKTKGFDFLRIKKGTYVNVKSGIEYELFNSKVINESNEVQMVLYCQKGKTQQLYVRSIIDFQNNFKYKNCQYVKPKRSNQKI